MKKGLIIGLFILFSLTFVLAEDISQSANQVVNNVTSMGKTFAEKTASLDIFNFQDFKVRFAEFVLPLNQYAEMISNILFGSSLDFTWIFAVSIFFWLLLVLILNGVIGDIFNLKWYFSIIIGIIIATIAMRAFANNLTLWISTIANTWYSAIAAIISAIIIYIIYILLVRPFLSRGRFEERKEEAEKTGAIIRAERDIAKKDLDSYKK